MVNFKKLNVKNGSLKTWLAMLNGMFLDYYHL